MLWKAARVLVVVSACAVVASAIAAPPQHREPRHGSAGPGSTPATDEPALAPSSSPSGPGAATSPTPTATGSTQTTSRLSAPSPGPGATPPPVPLTSLPLPITNVTAFGAIGNGHTDSTNAIARAASAAESRGGTLFFPAGHYMLSGSGIGSALEIRAGRPLTIAGAGSGLVTLTNMNAAGGLLSIRVDRTIVEGLTLDAQSANTRQALGVVANEVTVQRCRLLGGRQFFAIYYAGPAGASPSHPTYDTGNRLINDVVSDQVDNDGISWSFQENSLIENLEHTGSRLALYVDRYVTVQNEIYHPGPQSGGTAGFWISAPSDHITINNFTSYGMGGIISDNGTDVSTNITINNERLMVPGNTLRVDAASGFTIRGCNFGVGGTLLFTGSMTTTAVVEDCAALPMIRLQGSAKVSAVFWANAYPGVSAPGAQHLQTFFNFNTSRPSFTVNGGVWTNRAGGFLGGAPADYAVSNLSGYP